MISYSESYFKLLVSASCCLLLATKVRAKKRDICSSSSISTEIGMNLSDWFYPWQQIEPTKREIDYWNTIIPTVLFYVLLSNGYFFKVMLPTEARLWASEILAYTSVVATFLRRSEEYDRRQGKPSLTTGWHRRGGGYPRPNPKGHIINTQHLTPNT